MNFLELVHLRQSVRSYDKERSVEREKLERCIEAVRLAPSACNAQPWKLIVVDDPDLKEEVAKATISKLLGFNHFTKQSPILVVLVREEPNITSRIGTMLKDKPYTIMDVGIAAEHFCLQAADEGLGTCIMGWFDEARIKKILKIPKKKHVELVISLGYPDRKETRTKIRKKTGDICTYNAYQP